MELQTKVFFINWIIFLTIFKIDDWAFDRAIEKNIILIRIFGVWASATFLATPTWLIWQIVVQY